jgi:RND family efflux transporter MFP subunit
MVFWKQIAIAAVVLLFGTVAFARLYPGASGVLSAAGVPGSLVALLSGGDGTPRSGNQSSGPQRETLVRTATVQTAKINDRFAAIGDGGALRSVAVVPLVSGLVREVLVRPGDKVKEGQVLARLDSDAEKIIRDRALISVQSLKQKVERTEQLTTVRAASEVALSDAQNEYQTATLALRDAELLLQRRTILSPIEGIAGIVDAEVGDYVTTDDQIVTIDNRSSLLVDFWVPERFAPLVAVGQDIEASPIAIPGRVVNGKVTAIASQVESASRTLQVRARIGNSGDSLRPGMSFRVSMRFPGETYPAVDPLAIQWSSDGAFVWKVEDGKAQRVPVKIVQRNSDSVLVEAAIAPGMEVVTEGVQSLRQGAALRVANSAGGLDSGG